MLRRLKNVLLAPLRGVDRYVLVHYAVESMMLDAVATSSARPESGGILLGSVRGPHLEIVDYTKPGRNDERSMTSFARQDLSHQIAADRALKKSEHDVGFIGEWHTHPSGAPVPSMIDRASWSRLAEQSGHPMCFFLASPQGWRVFQVAPRKSSATPSELAECERGVLGVVFR
jgi:integrative and conjugative element protein (TIGR02256 family)